MPEAAAKLIDLWDNLTARAQLEPEQPGAGTNRATGPGEKRGGLISEQITARHDPALNATVVRHTPLYDRNVIGPGSERPPFVRAGSSLARLVDGLAVLQDDANYLALIDRKSVEA